MVVVGGEDGEVIGEDIVVGKDEGLMEEALDVVAVGLVVIIPLVEEGFTRVDVDEDAVDAVGDDVMTGLGIKYPSAQTLPHPSKQHLPD